MVSVFHEVGRIDELPSFPFPEIGVDNDGVLVSTTAFASWANTQCGRMLMRCRSRKVKMARLDW